jgi:hypothetical protein
MSAMKWVVPEERLKRVTFPSVPTGTVTELGMICPATKLMLEELGR